MSRAVGVGDQVQLRPHREYDARRLYGDLAVRPFVVEVVDRSRGRYAVAGGGRHVLAD